MGIPYKDSGKNWQMCFIYVHFHEYDWQNDNMRHVLGIKA